MVFTTALPRAIVDMLCARDVSTPPADGAAATARA